MTQVTVWAAWIGGLVIGLYGLAQHFITGTPLGVSSGYSSVCGLASRTSFFRRSSPNNERLWFIIGIPLGGLVAALTSPGEIHFSMSLGPMYDSVFPSALWARGALLVAGGAMMGLGARMADGCTSGHAITGVALLNPPSMLAGAGFFVGGIASVQLLFRVVG
ncbi:MAG: YeeE/YedE family protein [Myxococcales bacterium]|nr:YeeE/YedE family protein [Myxococcales bacterium]